MIGNRVAHLQDPGISTILSNYEMVRVPCHTALALTEPTDDELADIRAKANCTLCTVLGRLDPRSARKVKQMKKAIVWSIFLVLSQLNGTSRAQSQDDIAKQFVGMWRLVSNPQRLSDGTTRQGSNRVAY